MNEPVAADPGILERLVVAIDGPSGSGKSTVARGAATRLGLRYLDTGAMYRAVTWAALRAGVPLDDPAAVARVVAASHVEISTDPRRPGVRTDGVDVTDAIRTAEVTSAVSAVSAVPAVRERLVGLQRAIVGAGGIVVEGRDIGTLVCPDAPVKIFLTASGHARAERRARELAPDGAGAAPGRDVVELTRADLDRRDRLDSSRAASPLAKADDAVELDTTAMSADGAIEAVVAACRSAAAVAGAPRGGGG